MAYDGKPDLEPMKYHCCDTPRGMCYYILDDLTESQQTKLNDLKLKLARENEQYLREHPEIRACVALLTRYVFKLCPTKDICEVVAKFFARSRLDIEKEIKEYILKRQPANEGDSAVGVFARSTSADSVISAFDISSLLSDDIGAYPFDYISSMRNIDFNELEYLPSGTFVTSISQWTKTGFYETDKLMEAHLEMMMESIIVEDILDKIPYGDEDFPQERSRSLVPTVSFNPFVAVSHTSLGRDYDYEHLQSHDIDQDHQVDQGPHDQKEQLQGGSVELIVHDMQESRSTSSISSKE